MKVTIRADSVDIEGYVNAVGRDSRKMRNDRGEDFVEQMQPGVFARALSRANVPIGMLLNHKQNRLLSDTDHGLELREDTIGLYAKVANITDPEVVEAARAKRLVGWSFGFLELDSRETYDYDQHVCRSIVTELDLKEVSVIDDTMTPAYSGTSIEARADENKNIRIRATDIPVEYSEERTAGFDYSKYEEEIERLRKG